MAKLGMTGRVLAVAVAAAGAAFVSSGASAMSLREAIATAIQSSPDVGATVSSREANEFALRVARGGYYPTLDVTGRAGAAIVDNLSTRARNDDDHVFGPVEGRLTATQLLFDGFGTDAAVETQASLVDAASFEVMNRVEFVAVEIAQAYFDIIAKSRILAHSQANVEYHQRIVDDLTRGTSAGAISVADRQQAEERIFAARAFMTETREELESARIRFRRLVGQDPGKISTPRRLGSAVPGTLSGALALARANNPGLHSQGANIDAANARIKGAESQFYPKLTLEATGAIGEDLDGVRGRDAEAKAEGVVRWNLFRGGIDVANREEQIRRTDEERHRLRQVDREVEEGIRQAWNKRAREAERLDLRSRQLATTDQLLNSYTEQFKVGNRSLLVLLDTQNTRFNAQVRVATADSAVRFSEYRILATAGVLTQTLGVAPPDAARPYAREQARVPSATKD